MMLVQQYGHDGSLEWIRIVSAIILSLIFICSLPLNSLLIHVLRTRRHFLMERNRFVGILLTGELLVRVLGSPLLLTSMIAGRWLFGHAGCIYYAFLMTWIGITSMTILSVIAIERFLIVVPRVPILITRRMTIAIACLCGLHGLIWAVAPLSGWNEYVLEPSGVSCAPNWAPQQAFFVVLIATEAFGVPFVCMVVCYGTILFKVRTKSQTQMMSQISDIKLTKTMLLIMAGYLVCWTPYAIFALLETFGFDMSRVPIELTFIPITCAKTAGMVNPILYGMKNVAIRKDIFALCKRILYRRYTLDLSSNNDQISMQDADSDRGGITCTRIERVNLSVLVHEASNNRDGRTTACNSDLQSYPKRARIYRYNSQFSRDMCNFNDHRDRPATLLTPRSAITESHFV